MGFLKDKINQSLAKPWKKRKNTQINKIINVYPRNTKDHKRLQQTLICQQLDILEEIDKFLEEMDKFLEIQGIKT